MKTHYRFNRQEIDAIVARAFDGEQVHVLNYRLTSHSTDKVGFLGNHQNLEMTVKRTGKSEPETHRFFVKSMPQLSEEQLKFIRERNLFGQEATYFNDVVPLLQKACPTTEEWCPKVLFASDDLLVLEDMRSRNYSMSNAKILNEDQLRAAFKAQARLHAASLVAEKQLGKPLNEIYFKGPTPIFNDQMVKTNRHQLIVEVAEKVAERLGLDGRRISAVLHKGFHQMYDQSTLSTSLPKVLIHGDPWPNNYLFGTNDPLKCVLVDFQLSRYGPPMYDSVVLAYLSTDRDFRRRQERKAIVAYHEQLCEVLQTNDPEIKRPTLEDIVREYEEMRITAFFCAVLYYPIIGVSKSTLDRFNEEELHSNIMFREENSFVMKLYDEDKVFAARINEVIQEAFEYFEQRDIPIEPKNGLH